MKKKVTHLDGRVEEFEGTAQEFRELDEVPWRLTPPPMVPGVTPWVSPHPAHIVKWAGQEECAIARYFRDNPKETSVAMVCQCPRCSVQCSAWDGLAVNNPGMMTAVKNIGTLVGCSNYGDSIVSLDLSNSQIPAVVNIN